MPLRAGAIGVNVTVIFMQGGSVLDISGATTKQIKIRQPDGTLLTKAGAFVTDGTNGELTWLTTAGSDLVSGPHKVQGYAITPAWTDHTEIGEFPVDANLS